MACKPKKKMATGGKVAAMEKRKVEVTPTMQKETAFVSKKVQTGKTKPMC